MASPLTTASSSGKRTVDLAGPRVRGSRIRRSPPPPPEKEISPEEIREIERRRALIGIAAIALAISLIVIGISQNWGFSLAGYTVRL